MEEQAFAHRRTERSLRNLLQKTGLLWTTRGVVGKLKRWNELARQRQQLRSLSDHQLKDIGLSRADVSRIAGNRWFWDDPVNRKEDLDQRYRSSDQQRTR